MKLEPRCSVRQCIHFVGFTGEEDQDKQRPICSAFPKSIPDEIAYGNNKHTKPYPGDNGIQYEKDK